MKPTKLSKIVNFDMLITFSFGVSSNLSQQKSLTAEIIGKYFFRTIVPRKYMSIISDVGLLYFVAIN